MKHTLVFVILLSLTACTHGSMNIEAQDSMRTVEVKLPAIEKGDSQVCFIREENNLNVLPGVSPTILVGKKVLGSLKSSSFFCSNMEPSKYTFTSSTSAFIDRSVDVQTSPNRRYFVEWAVHDYGLWQKAEMRELSKDVGLSKIYRISH